MNKIILFLAATITASFFSYASAQTTPVLTASLHANTPPATIVSAGTLTVDVARITLSASGGEVTISGIYLDTDVAGGKAWNASVGVGTYSVDYTTKNGSLGNSNDGAFLKIDNGKYGYAAGTTTSFKRKVEVESGKYKCDQDLMRVKSVVSIGGVDCDSGASGGCVRIEDEFYDWRRETNC